MRYKPITVELIALLVLTMTISACSKPENPMLNNLQAAVGYRDITSIDRLIAAGADMEQRDANGQTPLIAAASSDQFEIAEHLIAAGADIWALDDFGMTAGRMAQRSLTPATSDEGRARERVIKIMKQRGFPFPAPDRAEVLRMVRTGEWAKLKAVDKGL